MHGSLVGEPAAQERRAAGLGGHREIGEHRRPRRSQLALYADADHVTGCAFHLEPLPGPVHVAGDLPTSLRLNPRPAHPSPDGAAG